MKVRVKLVNGIVATIFGVKWHPSYVAHLEGFDETIPAGCYVRKSSIQKKVDNHNQEYDNINEPNLKWNLKNFIEDIECAEMPFDILDDESETAWKNFGNCMKEVHYGLNEDFWENHC